MFASQIALIVRKLTGSNQISLLFCLSDNLQADHLFPLVRTLMLLRSSCTFLTLLHLLPEVFERTVVCYKAAFLHRGGVRGGFQFCSVQVTTPRSKKESKQATQLSQTGLNSLNSENTTECQTGTVLTGLLIEYTPELPLQVCALACNMHTISTYKTKILSYMNFWRACFNISL